MFSGKRSDLRLMSAGELEKCFPSSKIIKQRVTFMAETLIAVGGDIADKCASYDQKGTKS